jgi:adiponectin receptor
MSAAVSSTTTDIQLVQAAFRLRQRRRLSAPASGPLRLQQICGPLPHSLEALDLSNSSPTQALASLRFLVLSYLADLEARLSYLNCRILDLGITESLKAKGELTIDETRIWARVALEMLKDIRADVCSHLPGFHFADISVDGLVKSHLPDVQDIRSRFPHMADVRSHLPDMPDVRSHLPDLSEMRSKLDDVRSRFSGLDFRQPMNYIPTLSNHLQSLQSHLASLEFSTALAIPSLAPSTALYDLLDSLLSSDILAELLPPPSRVIEGEIMLERAARDISEALKRSFEGSRLIKYMDLPQQWRNNPFVTQGYR